jgi:hypothetical protein
MNQATLEQAAAELIEMFGDKLPDPDHCPKEFEYYFRLYLYEKKLNESADKSV